ncbi:MAG: ComEC/Rec2 family competence protein, partial [Alphaproteobacteria bacterium]|nr:ComEC/Rec2 family competence protein [Alphaproteobacteria bacterium]
PTDYTWSEAFSLSLERARKTLARHVYNRLSGDIAAVTAAKLNGEQTGISSPVMEAMRTAGLAHLLATSGANVTIMGLLVYFPLRALLALWPAVALRYPIKKWAAVAAIFSALAFTFLVGSQAATARSMVMVALAMAAVLLDRQTNILRLVMISALLSMVFAPSATMGASFQMSFFAVFCLVAANHKSFEENRLSNLPGWLGSTAGIARASLIATAATAPFTIYHFQTFNAYGFVSNVLAIPITSFWVMPFTLLAYIAAPLNLDGFFIDMAGLGNALTIRIATTVAAWPHAVIPWPAMPGASLAAIVLGNLWLCIWREKWRAWGLLPILLGMAYPLYTTQPDFLISPTGKSWAARLDDGRFAVSNAKREKFALSQWQQRLGDPDFIDAKALGDNAQIRCDSIGCVYRKNAAIVAMPIKDFAALDDCAKADIVVAAFPLSSCAAKVIDIRALEQHGAHAIFFNLKNLRIAFASEQTGFRPWSTGRKSKNGSDENGE